MPRFLYSARDASGRTLRDAVEAPARRDAMRILSARGLQVLEIVDSSVPAATRNATPAARADAAKFSAAERLPFLQALSDLTASGMPAGEAVRLLSVRIKAPRQRALCAGLWEKLGEGLPLSQALGAFPAVFDVQTVNLVAAGEATGNLKEVLTRLIQHFTEQKELRQQVVAALAYPLVVCAGSIGVILFFIFFLMPRIQSLLRSLGGKLPLPTRMLVGLSDFLIHYGLLVLIAGVLGGIAAWRWRQTEKGRVTSDGWLLKLPLAGGFVISSTVHNFSQTLAVLLENGVTTAEALRMTERTITHRTLRAAFTEATDRVLEGEKLSTALARTGCFPDLVLDRLSVGESTGNLAPSLRDIARTFQNQLQQQLAVFRGVLSYGVLFFAFGFVTLVAVAIVLAVFQVSASFKF
jgi:type II secretory pathway component PulF